MNARKCYRQEHRGLLPGPPRLYGRPRPRETLAFGGPGRPQARGSGLRTSRVSPSTLEACQQVRGPGRPGASASSPPLPALSPWGTAAGAPSARPGGPHGAGARAQSPPGPLPPRTPTCRPRMRTGRPARPAAPRPAARGQCAGAAADASVYVRARRWRRRGKRREESDERRGSLKRAAMALRNPQVAARPRPGRERPRAAAGGPGAGGRTLPGASVWEWGRAPGHAAPD